MLATLLLTALLSIQLRAPETLRPPATPPPDGTGKFQDTPTPTIWTPTFS